MLVARRRPLTLTSTPAGVVLQPGVAQRGFLPQRCQQRHFEGQPAGPGGGPPLRRFRVQSPAQPHQGAAHLRRHVS